MGRLDPARIGLWLAITMGLFYLLCVLMVALAPASLSAVVVDHGLNAGPSMRQAVPLSLSAGLLVLLALMTFSYIAGLSFGLLNNMMLAPSPYH